MTVHGQGRWGDSVALLEGQPVFVFGAIEGEEVRVEVVKRRRQRVVARVVEVLAPSPHRVTPPCPYFGPCTGCQWQHIEYTHQLELKRRAVVQALEQSGGLADPPVAPTLPSNQTFGYRNHARFTVDSKGRLGFVNRETRRFVEIDRCLIMHPAINQLLAQLQGKCGETTQLSIRYGVNTGEFLIQPRLRSPQIDLPTGQTHYHERVGGHTFRIASPAFFQVNTQQVEVLVRVLREGLRLEGQGLLVDAYAGVGTFAVLLASYVQRVVAIEESPPAVEDARANAADLPNVQFILGRTEEVLGRLDQRPDAVVVDPPRKGCLPGALEALARLAPPRLAYVSCDPHTLARDLRSLVGGGFSLESVQPIDMFPQTHHVECVAILTHQGAA